MNPTTDDKPAPIPRDADEARVLRIWATSPALTESDLMDALPAYRHDPRKQAVLDRAIEERRKAA